MGVPEHVLNIEGDRVHVPASAFELPGFRTWVKSDDFPEGVRASWVDGEVFVEISPESIESHNKTKTAVTVGVVQVVRLASVA